MPTLFPIDTPHLRRLREVLVENEYNQERLASMLRIRFPSEGQDMPLLIRRSAEPIPFNALFRLFYLGLPVDGGTIRAVLPEPLFNALTEAALLLPAAESFVRGIPGYAIDAGADLGGFIKAAVKIAPFEDLYFASDYRFRDHGDKMAEDHVVGVGMASITLSNFSIRRRVQSTLDIGTGTGIQALLAARHSERVVGTDMNDRALGLAEFNARLNGIENIEWRKGSFFEPVAGETFDSIVANPPFVISPRSRYLYRDGGLGGDGVSELVVRNAAKHLNEGGYAIVLANWYYPEGREWDFRPRTWLEGAGCDCWLVRSGSADPLSYAANWLKETDSSDPVKYAALLDEWVAYFKQEGIHGLCTGALTLRKRGGGKNWVRSDTMEALAGNHPGGDHVHRIFLAEDYLNSLPDDDALFNAVLKTHPDLTITQTLQPDGEEWAAKKIALGFESGLPIGGTGDWRLVQVLMRLNGSAPLRAVLERMQNEMGDSEPPERYAAVVKQLIRSGMVVPV